MHLPQIHDSARGTGEARNSRGGNLPQTHDSARSWRGYSVQQTGKTWVLWDMNLAREKTANNSE